MLFSKKRKRRNDIDLILSSSGVRAPCFIGAIKAIEEKGYAIKRIAGTSGGAIIAAGYALGKSVEELEELAPKCPYRDFKTFNYKNLLSLKNPSLYSGRELDSFYKQVFGNTTLKDFQIDCRISIVTIVGRKKIILSKETHPNLPVWKAVRMSSTIPFIFPYLDLQGAAVTDGGLVPRMFDVFSDYERPIVALRPRSGGALGRVFREATEKTLFLWNYIKIVAEFLFDAIDNQHVPEDEWERTIVIPTHNVSSFNFELGETEVKKLIEYGHEAVTTSDILPDLNE